MPDIFETAISDGLAAQGLTQSSTPSVPVDSITPPTPVDTAPPPVEVAKVADTAPSDAAPAEDKVSINDFKDAFSKVQVRPEIKTSEVVQQKVESVESRDSVLTELMIPKEQWPLFRKMGNESFNHVKEIIKQQRATEAELTTLKKAPPQQSNTLPASYYEHEDGYTLHPEVRKAQQTAQQANYELQHWQNQFMKIEAGEDWQDLDIDAKGHYVTKDMQASSQAKLAVLNYIQQAKQILNEQSGYVNNVRQQWKQMHQQYVNSFKQAEDSYFPQYAKAADNQYISTMQKLLAEKGQGTNPLAGMFAKMYAFTMEQKAELDSLKQAKAAVRVNAQPPSAAFNGGGNPVPSDDVVSLDMFKTAMARR